jgi:hypothetical protein
MDTSLSEEESRKEPQEFPTAEDIKKWDEERLLKWLVEEITPTLKPKTRKKIEDAEISGNDFIEGAGDTDYL